jgi:two-component system nitrate/nitrite response regulator NarL
MSKRLDSHPTKADPFLQVSPREAEVLEMTSQGLTNEQIARRLDLSTHAVKFHLASIYRKLGVANRTEAAVLYLRSTDFPSA